MRFIPDETQNKNIQIRLKQKRPNFRKSVKHTFVSTCSLKQKNMAFIPVLFNPVSPHFMDKVG